MRKFDASKRFYVRKIAGRLGIYDRSTGHLAYAPSRDLILKSREGLKVLAGKFEDAGGPTACEAAITKFERKRTPRPNPADKLTVETAPASIDAYASGRVFDGVRHRDPAAAIPALDRAARSRAARAMTAATLERVRTNRDTSQASDAIDAGDRP